MLELRRVYSCMLLGAVLALIFRYPRLLHAPDSRDVRAATFVHKSGECYKLKPVVVPC
jgi:hypothetical protein